MQGRIIPVSHLKTGNSFTPPNLLLWYKDADEDGYGDPETLSSTYQEGYVQNNEDCDDTDARINPNTVWAIDRDGDGYGDPQEQKVQCEHPRDMSCFNQVNLFLLKKNFGQCLRKKKKGNKKNMKKNLVNMLRRWSQYYWKEDRP